MQQRYSEIKTIRAVTVALLASLAVLALAGPALATGPTGDYKVFSDCPYANLSVKQCIFSTTSSGAVKLGSTSVPITSPITLQGGTSFNFETEVETFYPATDGNTLSKTPQTVPGGLLNILPPEWLPEPLKKLFEEYIINKGPTGVTATTELAGSPVINSAALVEGSGVALKLPVKIKLNNTFLGSNCYIGSNSSPIIWNLTTGSTKPPAPYKSITGNPGAYEFLDEGNILNVTGDSLVDNNFTVPGASGCGGFLIELLEDPVINKKLEIPAKAGQSEARLTGNLERGYAPAVRESVK
jgi:hypothetical protein